MMGDDRNRRLQLVEAALLLDEDLNEAIGFHIDEFFLRISSEFW